MATTVFGNFWATQYWSSPIIKWSYLAATRVAASENGPFFGREQVYHSDILCELSVSMLVSCLIQRASIITQIYFVS